MSWSAYYIGTPEKITEALKSQAERLSGNSKTEMEEAIPHIDAILKMNHHPTSPYILQLEAGGSAYDGQSSCYVNIKNIGSALV